MGWKTQEKEKKRAWVLANREKQKGYSRKYREANREKVRESERRSKLKHRESRLAKARTTWAATDKRIHLLRWRAWRYGTSKEEVLKFLATRPVCEICGGPPTDIDHHHDTNYVRGHLCHGCNSGIGHFAEDPARLRAAADYLEKHQQVLKLLG
jgi:hypothetical protein